ncbi:hypothetical protein [Mucilaginibacter sp. OK283]|uniref:hypothetical protein n=1 Tax=Mucilaginibacter sp. OK283 TaxID=1881049 RepID=UPI0008ADD372|nr:hypothetical protein [Mucilaginibacter sp. OK283]SEO14446.1 hypothetical protein SAMN05428947_101471 [Mucilaginibacter sp. OK283]
MKTLDAATIRDMAEDYTSKIMLATMATLCIRFIRTYIAALVWFQIIFPVPFLNCAYVRKRIANRITHRRKFALFQRCGEHGSLQNINNKGLTCH